MAEESDRELFLKAIQLSLADWGALDLAIQHGMGGDMAVEKRQWMAGVVCDLFLQNKQTAPDEVEDYLDDLVDENFNTVLEDGSVVQLARNLCKLHELYVSRDHNELTNIINHKEVLLRRREDHKLERAKEATEVIEQLSIGNENGNMEDVSLPLVDDGWTVVDRKKKK